MPKLNPGRVSLVENQASDKLRILFLSAVGRSGKNETQAANEVGLSRNVINRWCGGNHLAIYLHPRIEKWISEQTTDLTLARAKRSRKLSGRLIR